MSVSAATLSIQATPTTIGVDDVIQISILVDSAIPVNAFSGALIYPATIVEPIAVSDGNSIVNMWITRPTVSDASAQILFAGITPGGFSGNNGILFSVLFKAKKMGTAKVSLGNIEVLRNDGSGGSEPTTIKSLTISVGLKSSGGYTEPVDHTPPELFIAYLGTDPQLFDGRSYLAFMAVDKGTGVDHYVAAESRIPSFLWLFFPPSWHTTVSPYVLSDQNFTSTVYLKAIDRAGNERLSVFPPQHLFTPYEKVVFLAILVGAVLLWQRRWGRRLKSNL